MARDALTIRAADGSLKSILPGSWTTIRAWKGGSDICVVYHGTEEDYEVRLDPVECRQMITVAWSDPRSKCPEYRQNACWYTRQMYAPDAPPARCIKCQLTRIYIQARQGDPRPLPKAPPRSPLFVAGIQAVMLMGFAWAGIQPYNVQARARFAAETELRRERQARQRAEAELVKLRGVVTFRGQRKAGR